ncbi:MAG TPA: hypothetical protein VG895_04005 [Patescibacteria group bacterium]|nr:hypothetical protein [Patescibacteria group bacterium]
MSSEKLDNTSFCQICGAFLPAGSVCPDCNKVVTTMTKPKEVLPFCGIKDTNSPDECILRDCCRCGKCWKCTAKEWIEGPCPHCGAVGFAGIRPEKSEQSKSGFGNLISDLNKEQYTQEIVNFPIIKEKILNKIKKDFKI